MAISREKGVQVNRYYFITILIIILMSILAFRLFVVSILQKDVWSQKATGQNTKYIYTVAPRGNIYDRNGVLLAGNRQIFTVQMVTAGMTDEEINKSTLDTLATLEANGDTFEDDFPIIAKEDGTYEYKFDRDLADWLSDNGFSQDDSPEAILASLRATYEIDENLDRFDGLEQLQRVFGVYPPIYPKTMEFSYKREKDQFLRDMGFEEKEIKKGISASECVKELKKKYEIKDFSEADAHKILAVRYKIIESGNIKYLPTTLSKKVSINTIAKIEEAGIKGVSIATELERYYPYGESAAHILGYIGTISSSELDYYVKEKGYRRTDMVGKFGIEGTYESILHGTDGIKEIQVNSNGHYVDTITEKQAQKGKDVYLSIDINMQQVAEKALKDNIEDGESTSLTGSTVAVDVNTGKVLAMANYPSFDPNIFADGITTEEWKSLQKTNPRDLFAPAPLVNVATSVAVSPGSSFKPITALTALEKGLNPNRIIQDKGHIDIGGTTWACYTYNTWKSTDGPLNLETALGTSCNYYMYCISSGKDWTSGASLGYNIEIQDMLNMAKAFGLDEKTGIELNESVLPLPTEEGSIASHKVQLWNVIYAKAKYYFPEKIYSDEDKLRKNIDTICSWISENPPYEELINRLKEKTDVIDSKAQALADIVKFDYFNQAKWTMGDRFNISIGQGDDRFTPLQMARYTAGMGAYGSIKKMSVVEGIEGEGKVEPVQTGKAPVSESSINAVFKGMRRVSTNGGLAPFFRDYPIEVLSKTGTAENQSVKQPASEVDYIKDRLSSLNSRAGTNISWEEIEKRIKQLRNENPNRFPTDDDAVDLALIQLSDYNINNSMINAGKGVYRPNTWAITLAPADSPKLAISTFLMEGDKSAKMGEIPKKIYSYYFGLENSKSSTTATSTETGANISN